MIPYAADCRRFRPLAGKRHGPDCTFLFAGGISQRKGIKYLLEAWRRIRRPGWRLQLSVRCRQTSARSSLTSRSVEPLGRVAHAEMPARMAAADVFVFPSLFEGSAVVTYEALACGLPSVVTPDAGSVVRDGIEGFVVPAATSMPWRSGWSSWATTPSCAPEWQRAARCAHLDFDWPRYHEALVAAVDESDARWRRPPRLFQCNPARALETRTSRATDQIRLVLR